MTRTAVVAFFMAAAFVVVPRLSGTDTRAEAAEEPGFGNSWRVACNNNLDGGTVTRAPVKGGWWFNCDAMEVYVGKGDDGPSIGKEGAPTCVGHRMTGLFISDGELAQVKDVYWDPYRGWFGQGGKEASRDGYATPTSVLQAAGVLQGKDASGKVLWEHQYGSNVANAGSYFICKAPNPA